MRDAHLHTIRATPLNAANRFYDKPFTLVIDPSTRAGATGEHSPCDALVPSIVSEYCVVEGVDVDAFDNMLSADSVTGWERLDWVTDDKILKECKVSDKRARIIMEDSDDSVLWFKEYGTDWIKGVGKYRGVLMVIGTHHRPIAGFPPDAYIQLCLQLAWYSTRENFTATYETVLTRMFKRGRTETLRSLTRESREWVLSMHNPHCSVRIIKIACRVLRVFVAIITTRASATGNQEAHTTHPRGRDRAWYRPALARVEPDVTTIEW